VNKTSLTFYVIYANLFILCFVHNLTNYND
jgi:hypothetical protein